MVPLDRRATAPWTADGDAPQRIVVVGASLAGVAAAEELRRRGFDGALTILGEEVHAPYDRPPLTKAVLAGTCVVEDCALRPPAWAAEHDVDVRLGARAVGLDLHERAVELASGERVGFDGVVVATGATPRTLAAPALEGVFTVRTLDDALALREALRTAADVVIVGGGFVGAEVAAAARGLGAAVTLVEADPVPLGRALGGQIGGIVTDVHRDHGVAVRSGVPVVALEGERRVERVRLADGSAIAADVVVVGLGVRPATAWLEGSGTTLRDGVACDAFCRASAPGVVAAGDVARWEHPSLGSVRIEHWENAVTQGRAAAVGLLGAEVPEPYAPVPYVWSAQYEHKIQMVGSRRPDDELIVVDGALDDRRFVAVYSRGGQVTAAISFNRPSAIMKVRRLMRSGATVSQVTDALDRSAAKRRGTPPLPAA